MRVLVHGISRRNEEYIAPEAEVIIIQNETSFLTSGDDDGDNEHTGEEDLF